MSPDVPRIKFKKGTKITRSKHAIRLVRSIANQQQEFGVVLTIRANSVVSNIRIVSIGAFNESTLSVRDTLRGAITDNAYGIIFVHNHPGGTVCPTSTDYKFVKVLKKAGKLLDIEVMDSIIVSGKKWRSMR